MNLLIVVTKGRQYWWWAPTLTRNRTFKLCITKGLETSTINSNSLRDRHRIMPYQHDHHYQGIQITG